MKECRAEPDSNAIFGYRSNKDSGALSIVDGTARNKNEILISIHHDLEDATEPRRGGVIAIPKSYIPILSKVLSDIEKGD